MDQNVLSSSQIVEFFDQSINISDFLHGDNQERESLKLILLF